MQEIKMNQIEIDLIKTKIYKSKIFLLGFLLFIVIWLVLWFQMGFNFLSSIIGFILIVFILILMFTYLNTLKKSRKDFKQKIKISENLKVKHKYIHIPFNRGIHKYLIKFESDKIRKYQVKKDIYEMIEVDDIIHIEYSKFACWILKIEYKGYDIYNKDIVA